MVARPREDQSPAAARLTVMALRATLPPMQGSDEWILLPERRPLSLKDLLVALEALPKPASCSASRSGRAILVRCDKVYKVEHGVVIAAVQEHLDLLRVRMQRGQVPLIRVQSQDDTLLIDGELYHTWANDYFVSGLVLLIRLPVSATEAKEADALLTFRSARGLSGSLIASPEDGPELGRS